MSYSIVLYCLPNTVNLISRFSKWNFPHFFGERRKKNPRDGPILAQHDGMHACAVAHVYKDDGLTFGTVDTDSFAFASGLVRDLDKLLNFGNRRAGEVLDRDEGVFQVREGVVGRYLLRGERDQVVNPLLHQESNLGKKKTRT